MNRKLFRAVSILSTTTLILLMIISSCTSTKITPPAPTPSENSASQNTTAQKSTNTQSTSTVQADTSLPSSAEDSTQTQESTAPKQDVKVKALYLTGWTVSSTAKVNHYIELAKTTEINSYVVDIKDDDGYVGYESQLSEVKQNGTYMKKYDPDKVLKAFHDNGIHVIGRIVCFKDPVYSTKRPDLAIKNVNGGLWKDNNKNTWLNPYNQGSWSYLVNIAKEAVQKGFDEIQFDYVRFPSDGNKKLMDLGGTGKQKYEAIDAFLAYAKKEIPNVKVSADVFGIICESPADVEDIGQNLEYVGRDVDFISPMAYPSHYALGQIVNGIKFTKPDLEPYKVVYNTLTKAKNRISKVNGYNAQVRPYLQDFTAKWIGKGNYQTYGAEQVKEEIKAVYDAGYDQWILWDAANKYSEDALQKK